MRSPTLAFPGTAIEQIHSDMNPGASSILA
jgi:hypothetical protein